MPPTYPRTAIKQNVDGDPVPWWWLAEFHGRQARVRDLLLDRMSRAPGPLVWSQLNEGLGGFWASEKRYALAALVRQGLIIRRAEMRTVRSGNGTHEIEHADYRIAQDHHGHARKSRPR